MESEINVDQFCQPDVYLCLCWGIVWQAVLYDVSRVKVQEGPGSGVALFHPQSDGSFTYELQLMQFPGRPTHMTIETYPRKGRRRVVDDISSSFGNGWANGSYIKQQAKDLASLMSDELVMNIVNDHTAARMQGHIKQVFYEEVHSRSKLEIFEY